MYKFGVIILLDELFRNDGAKMRFEVKENIKRYEEVINNFCFLLMRLGIADNPLKIYETFRYMLLHNYLSIGYFSDEIPDWFVKLEMSYIQMDITGSMILANYGVCRHTTDFLYHVYDNLGYDSSYLFTYHPILHIDVYNGGRRLLTNFEAQTYIDDAIKDIDLFSQKELYFIKKVGDIEMIITYLPPDIIPNHCMNIVRNKESNRIFILDSRYDCIGEKIDDKQVNMDHQGLTHIDFVQKEFYYRTYYGTDYSKGVELLKQCNTDAKYDVLHSIFYKDACKDYKKVYEEFKMQNQNNYQIVTNNFLRLRKRMI